MRLLAISLLGLTLLTARAYPQDAHYWTDQYGSRSRLLGGAVIGSVDDLAAVYYNPARLALIPDPGLLLSTRLYQYTQSTVKDGLGQGIDLNNENLASAPGFAAGMSRSPGKEHAWGYTIFSRVRSRVPFTVRLSGVVDIIQRTPGDESYAIEFKFTNEIKDQWWGFTWSWKRWAKSSIGVSTYLSYRRQKNEFRFLTEALAGNGDLAAIQQIKEYRFKTWDFLWKIGYALFNKNWSLGATLTTPRLNVAGSGNTLFNNLIIGLDSGDGGVPRDRLEVDYQRNLKPVYKTPLSVGFGAGFLVGSHRLHVSGEWFSKVKESVVMAPEPFVGQSTGDTLVYTILQEFKAVLNLGIGHEWYFADNIAFYGSFATDFSAATSDLSRLTGEPSKVYTANNRMNIYHAGIGIELRLKNMELTLGTTLSFGDDQIERLITLPPAGGIKLPLDEQENIATKKFRRIRLLLGFSFGL